jgi:hypothetical protein
MLVAASGPRPAAPKPDPSSKPPEPAQPSPLTRLCAYTALACLLPYHALIPYQVTPLLHHLEQDLPIRFSVLARLVQGGHGVAVAVIVNWARLLSQA